LEILENFLKNWGKLPFSIFLAFQKLMIKIL